MREYTERIPVALTQYLRERQRLSVRTMDNGPQHPSTVDVIIHLQLYFQIIILLLKEKKSEPSEITQIENKISMSAKYLLFIFIMC